MGGGSWTTANYVSYSTALGRSFDYSTGEASSQNMFVQRTMHQALNPYGVIRECVDSEEHPETIPVILALDVTGSMGEACIKTAKALNTIMTNLYENHKDIEFMVMGIGDLAYDDAPIQASQFESDIRIAEQTDQIYMERGGGGNSYESYTAAWYFGLYRTKLDCHKRGRKGIIITMGDEPLNPYLPKIELAKSLGCQVQGDIDTKKLYNLAKEQFDIYHIAVDDPETSYIGYRVSIQSSWGKLLGERYKVATINGLPKAITECINDSIKRQSSVSNRIGEEETYVTKTNPETGAISW